MKFSYKDMYLVIKRQDIDECLSEHDAVLLRMLSVKVRACRDSKGKKINSYIVINVDEPYYGDVVKIIERNT